MTPNCRIKIMIFGLFRKTVKGNKGQLCWPLYNHLVQAGRLEQARLSQELGFAQDSDDGSASDSSQGGSDSGGE